MYPRRHRLIITSLSLAGLCACDFDRTPDGEDEQFRQDSQDSKDPVEVDLEVAGPILIGPPIEVGPVEDFPVLDKCFTEFHLVFHHKDGTKDVSDSAATGLAEYARAGDLLALDFAVSPDCREQFGPRLTLVSYTGPGNTYGIKPQFESQAYDVHTAKFPEKGGQLSVRLPDCAFEVDLAFGEPLSAEQRKTTSYAAEHRLISSASIGKTDCSALPRLTVDRFDTVEPGWGEAPVEAHFGWKLTNTAMSKQKSTCSFDLDADGTPDAVYSPCPTDTSAMKLAALPSASFSEPGKHRPEMVVSFGERRLWAATTVFANHLEYKPGVRFLEQEPGFVGATLVQSESSATVELSFASAEVVPAVQVDDVIVGHGDAQGYMLRATAVQTSGAKVVVTGVPVGLDETISGGFLGVRELQLDTAGARCADEQCAGTMTVVDAPPGATLSKSPLALDQPQLKGDGQEAKFGVKIGFPLGEYGELELFGGVVVKEFFIDWGFLSVDAMNVEVVPTAEVALSFKDGMPTDSFEMGRFYMGTLPTPIPLSIHWIPRFDADLGFKFTGKLTFTAASKINKTGDAWSKSCEPKVTAEADVFGLEQAVEAKITHVLENEISLGLLTGPYIGPMAAVGFKGTTNGCEGCLTSFVEGGAELGWNLPWGSGNMFEPFKVVLAEIELWKKCWQTPLPNCEPPDPGPDGGCWGDVHMISLDGLLYDFQAGGEFVLVRATDGAPFEIQTRQEPMKFDNFGDTDLALSINTAVATEIDGHRVAFYTRHPDPVTVDGQPTPLTDGQSLPLGAGSVALAGDTYTLTYPSGEVVTLTRHGAQGQPRSSFSVHMVLPPGRAGQVEGLLGDGDGDVADDIALPGGEVLAQPVAFDQLYWAEDNFADAWRVAPTQTLFDYVGGASHATFVGEPYSLMPAILPPLTMPFVQLAQTECAACPDSLMGTCMTDVGFTGDATLAAACEQVPAEPVSEMPARTTPHGVYPLPKAQMDCARNELVFRAPGATQKDYYVSLAYWDAAPGKPDWWQGWNQLESFASTNPPPGGWGDKFVCQEIGAGWGECTLKLAPANSPCVVRSSNKYRWQVNSLPYQDPYLFRYEFFGASE